MMKHKDPKKKLLEWYASLPARRIDLVGDYAGSELFLVEGDSLLLRCLSDSKLDFNKGFQLLHSIYAVEHFLQGLVQRKCNFHIVFFQNHQEQCIPWATSSENRHKYLLARSVLIRHFQVHLPKTHPSITLRVFESLFDPSFEIYLKTSDVYFMLCHDGANPTVNSGNMSLSEEDAEEDGDEDDEDEDDEGDDNDDEDGDDEEQVDKGGNINIEAGEFARKVGFRSTICLLIKKGYNVALINGLEWMDTKVMAMMVEGSRRAPINSGLYLDGPDTQESQNVTPCCIAEPFLLKLGFKTPSFTKHQIDTVDKKEKSPEDMLKGLTVAGQPVFPERIYLALITLAYILKKKQFDCSLALSFLLHTVLIGETIISCRPQLWNHEASEEDLKASKFLAEFSIISRQILDERSWSSTMDAQKIDCDIADLIDGRLFYAISSQSTRNLLNKETSIAWLDSKTEELAQLLHSLCGVRVKYQPQITSLGGTIERNFRSDVVSRNKISVLPFSNAVFDKHLSSIKISIGSAEIVGCQSARIFQEISHWHNAKRRIDPKSIHPLTEKEKSRALRRNQFFMAEMQAYAASLTNASGKILEPETVTVTDAKKSNTTYIESGNSEDSGSSRKHNNVNATSNRKGAGKKAMLENIAASKVSKDNENAERLFSSWQTVRRGLDFEALLSSKYSKAKAYLRDLTDSKRNVLQAEVEFYILTVLVDIHRGLSSKSNDQGASNNDELYGVAALVWDSIRRLSSTNGLTKAITGHMKQILDTMNLPHMEIPQPTNDRKLSFSPNLHLSNPTAISIPLRPIDFQCLYCGPYMDRNLDSAPDIRVPFNPDGWQRKVLDELDADRSVFVVAPTSAGKTFISFYAMERILRLNDDSILVYIAPTKALVNQIGAEIQARYKKTYKHAGKSVWAIHTRDYRVNNPSGCQILVTVPHILQIMLLSPGNAKTWSKKVKTIIFDEIHSIGNAEDGVVWEQLLLLAPCPIIALSATVGNPEKFSSWLAATQESSGFQLTMIKHQHRYSDLRKFLFVPPRRFAFHGLAPKTSFGTLGLDGLEGLLFLHPVASLVNKSRGIPEDLSLEARDCLSLWQTLNRHQTPRYPINPSLDPENHAFPKILAKSDIIRWEENLKALLKAWMRDDNSPFDKVVKDLGNTFLNQCSSKDQISRRYAVDAGAEDIVEIDENNVLDTTLPLLCKLHERDALPVIFFNYDREKCEGICNAILSQLNAAETKWKKKSSIWKRHLSDWEQYKKEQAKMAGKRAPKIAPKKRGKEDDDGPGTKAERMQDAASSEASPFANFDPEAPIDGFHFAAKHKIESSELKRYFWQLTRRGISPWLMEALTRGIGVHHAGMNRKYRQVVEMLFRKGYLRVVIATGTLALGINMPCATVVFSGDSVFLTALNFRQAAGRAGRRGFDLLGNVVFQNISESKVCRLISSRLPDLNGHFPITTTLVLRLFTLLHESGNSPYAIQAINSLLSQPRLYLDGLAFKDQVLHHLRFSIEYLRRQSLLSSQGVPLNFAGLTSHLYYTENSSFALNALLKEGFFHGLCSDIKERESSVLRTLMIVMAHLFGRRPCRQVDQEYVETVVKRSSSIVFLPPLPSRAAEIIRQHNKETLQIFTTYVQTFVDQHIEADDCSLPLTGIAVGGHKALGDLAGNSSTPKVRSAFVALSGHGDSFDSISDLCQTTRSGVFLEEAVIPHLDVYPDEAKTPLNAYLYDFYMHGDLNCLERANGVRKSEVWFLLNDFSMVLATITVSLANFLKLPESDLSMLDVMGEGDEHINLEDDKFAAETPSEKAESSSASTASERARIPLPTAQAANPRKKKVADSWDDDDDDDNGDGNEAMNGASEGDFEGTSRSIEEVEQGFLNVYRALSRLRAEFDIKFKAIFA